MKLENKFTWLFSYFNLPILPGINKSKIKHIIENINKNLKIFLSFLSILSAKKIKSKKIIPNINVLSMIKPIIRNKIQLTIKRVIVSFLLLIKQSNRK